MSQDNCVLQPPQPLSKVLNKKEKLLIITALSGEFPYDLSDRLNIGKEYERILRHRLYQEGMIKSLFDDGLKGLVLTSKGVDFLKQKESERYRYISDKKRTEVSRRYRSAKTQHSTQLKYTCVRRSLNKPGSVQVYGETLRSSLKRQESIMERDLKTESMYIYIHIIQI